jgi:hypothetical protein
MDLRTGSVIQFMVAALATAPLAVLFESTRIAWSSKFVFALLWLVLVLSIGAVSLLYVLIRRGTAAQVASLFFLVPPNFSTAFSPSRTRIGARPFSRSLSSTCCAPWATARAWTAQVSHGAAIEQLPWFTIGVDGPATDQACVEEIEALFTRPIDLSIQLADRDRLTLMNRYLRWTNLDFERHDVLALQNCMSIARQSFAAFTRCANCVTGPSPLVSGMKAQQTATAVDATPIMAENPAALPKLWAT